jgi:hypothetical protein
MPALTDRYRATATPPGARCVARERSPGYGRNEPSAASVLAKYWEARDELAALDLDSCNREELCELLAGLVNEQTALAASESRLIPTFDSREAYRHDACITTTSWLRWKTGLGYSDAQRRWKRARLLRHLPMMAAAFDDAKISAQHVDAVVDRAVPARVERIAEHDATLTQLARDGEPRDVRVAVQRIVELVDPDGSESPTVCKDEDLRQLHVRRAGFAKLGAIEGATSIALTELLFRIRDLYSTPDPRDTPWQQQRTPSQKFHDALRDALTVAIDHHPTGGVDGVRTHIVLFADLYTLLGKDELATITPRLGATGSIDAETARHLIATTNPTLRMVLGLGPWMPVSVGRARRVLPSWLRGASQLTHRTCAGPGCDRLFAWCEGDHRVDWSNGGLTALFNDEPLCEGHHDLKHEDGWIITFDVTTGVITWTSPDGKRRIEIKPDDP